MNKKKKNCRGAIACDRRVFIFITLQHNWKLEKTFLI